MKTLEEKRVYKKEYYLKNRDRILTYSKKKYWETREEPKGRWKNPESYERRMLTAAMNRVKKKGLEINIDISDIIIPEYCPILGVKLIVKRGQGCGPHDASPSLDRIDSSKGYIKGNVQVISTRANLLKNNATVEELKSIIRYMENGLPSRQS